MNAILKVVLLIVYGLAAASLLSLLPLPVAWATGLKYAVVILFSVHALEVVLVFRHVRLYRGSIAASVVLTMLFGLLHWKPMADAEARRQAS
jgi:hypothetical protein